MNVRPDTTWAWFGRKRFRVDPDSRLAQLLVAAGISWIKVHTSRLGREQQYRLFRLLVVSRVEEILAEIYLRNWAQCNSDNLESGQKLSLLQVNRRR